MGVKRTSLLLVALLLMLPTTVHAQSDEDKAAARALAKQGAEAFTAGKFDESIDLLTRAEAILHAPTHVLLIARAQVRLGRFVAAKENYLKVTREQLASNAPPAFKKAQEDAQEELTAIEPKIASLRIVVEGAGKRQVTVKLDDQPVADVLIGVHRPIDPGDHTVVAFATGLTPVKQSVKLGDGEKKDVKLVIPSGPPPSGLPVNNVDNPDYKASNGDTQPITTSSPGGTLKLLGIVGLGLGAVGVGGGVFFTITASGAQKDADTLFDMCQPNCSSKEKSEIESLDSDVASKRTLGIVGLIGGGVLMATGATLLVLGFTRKPAPAPATTTGWIAPYVAPNGLGVHGAF